MPELRRGVERGRHDVYGPTPTPETVSRKRPPAQKQPVSQNTPEKPPVPKRPIKQRTTPATPAPASRHMRRRVSAPAKYIEPVEVFTPEKDSDELREQVQSLLEHIVGGVALRDEIAQVFQNNPERRSVLLQRAGDALRDSGFAQEAIMQSAERLSDLTLDT